MSDVKTDNAIIHGGFEPFSRGHIEGGGDNLYVNAKGVIETIHRTDVNHDGYADIVLPNSHGYIERGPTWIYTPAWKRPAAAGKLRHGATPRPRDGEKWPRRELPNDSGWKSRVVDVDGDGYNDLIVVNGENGVTSELTSYVYWGGPDGLSDQRAEFTTVGAYDVAAVDLTGNGLLDLIFPSAWVDHHNRGAPLPVQVFHQSAGRRFEDVTQRYGLTGIGAVSLACADLTGDGRPDLVVANYRDGFEYETDSFIYWGRDGGFDPRPTRLPSHYALQVHLADLNDDGRPEIIFCGGDQVWIYWNDQGTFSPESRTTLDVKGFDTMFCLGAVRADVADVDGDGEPELILATEQGVQIRAAGALDQVQTFLPIPYATCVHAADLNGDGRADLIVSKYDDRVTYETESAVFWNGPDGFSADRVTRLATCGAMGCTAGDLDNDQTPQVIFNNTMLGPSQFWKDFPIYVYLGGPDHDYGPHRRLELPTGGGANGYIMADLDLDGYHDLVLPIQDGLRIFHGGPDGPKPDRYTDLMPQLSGCVMQVQVADLDHSGYLDLIVPVQTYDDKPETFAHSTVIFKGSADGYSVERSTVLPTYCSGNIHLVDLNGDGRLDVVVGDKRGYLLIYHAGPDGYSLDRTTAIELGVPSVGTINSADLNGNGYVDLVVGVQSHYQRLPHTLLVLYGGPDGYSLDRCQKYMGNYTPGSIVIADYDGDGNLDLLVGAYSSHVTRELPVRLFRGMGDTIDLDHPLEIHTNSGFQIVASDLSRNGHSDLIVICHRNDLGHQVDSLIYWQGPDGIDWDNPTPLPGMGPHWMTVRDPGNALAREPVERYISPPFELNGCAAISLNWDAHVPQTTQLRFQLRWADSAAQLDKAKWHGPKGPGTFYDKSGEAVRGVPTSARTIQYCADFVSPYGVASPQLKQVVIGLG